LFFGASRALKNHFQMLNTRISIIKFPKKVELALNFHFHFVDFQIQSLILAAIRSSNS